MNRWLLLLVLTCRLVNGHNLHPNSNANVKLKDPRAAFHPHLFSASGQLIDVEGVSHGSVYNYFHSSIAGLSVSVKFGHLREARCHRRKSSTRIITPATLDINVNANIHDHVNLNDNVDVDVHNPLTLIDTGPCFEHPGLYVSEALIKIKRTQTKETRGQQGQGQGQGDKENKEDNDEDEIRIVSGSLVSGLRVFVNDVRTDTLLIDGQQRHVQGANANVVLVDHRIFSISLSRAILNHHTSDNNNNNNNNKDNNNHDDNNSDFSYFFVVTFGNSDYFLNPSVQIYRRHLNHHLHSDRRLTMSAFDVVSVFDDNDDDDASDRDLNVNLLRLASYLPRQATFPFGGQHDSVADFTGISVADISSDQDGFYTLVEGVQRFII